MDFVVGETVLVDEGLTDYQALSTFFQLTEERGHPAPSVVVDQDGRPVTHPGYSDRMGLPHLRSGVWAFCREIRAEGLGLPSGTDWVRDHVSQLMFEGGSPYLNVPHFQSQLYVQRFGDPIPHLMTPMSSAGVVAFSGDGTCICVLEERLGHLVDGTDHATFVLWEYELALGRRRRIAGFPDTDRLGFVELSYSRDGRWILMCDWSGHRTWLVRVADGFVVPLPLSSAAVAWNPRNGPSALVVMSTSGSTGRLEVFDFDLATGAKVLRAEIPAPHGLPVHVRELTMSMDERALVTANLGSTGVSLLARGGVQIVAMVDIDAGRIEALMPVRFRTAGAERRHTSPRWCEDIARIMPSPTDVADHLLAGGYDTPSNPDPPQVGDFAVRHWTESLEGLLDAWTTGRTPPNAYAQDFSQLLMGVRDHDEDEAQRVAGRLAERASTSATARWIQSVAGTGNRLAFAATERIPGLTPPHVAIASKRGLDAETESALSTLIEAAHLRQILPATRALITGAHRAGFRPDSTWTWLAEAGLQALHGREYELAARVALATWRWNTAHAAMDPAVISYGLPLTGDGDATAILTNGFEACTHLPERTVLGRTADEIFDVEDIRTICQRLLARLPLVEHLRTVPRSTVPLLGQAPPDVGEHLEVNGPPFISYLHENAAAVGRIVDRLDARGIPVWIDRSSLTASEVWRRGITKAIRQCRFFVACFSAAYEARTRTYMDDEIQLALSEMRLLGRDRSWFVPVRLDNGRIPSLRINERESLGDLHFINFSLDWEAAAKQLTERLAPP